MKLASKLKGKSMSNLTSVPIKNPSRGRARADTLNIIIRKGGDE
jgi:hypothetical protein